MAIGALVHIRPHRIGQVFSLQAPHIDVDVAIGQLLEVHVVGARIVMDEVLNLFEELFASRGQINLLDLFNLRVLGRIFIILEFMFIGRGFSQFLEAESEVVGVIVMVTKADLVFERVGVGPGPELERTVLVVV